jgi:hypothetical protein
LTHLARSYLLNRTVRVAALPGYRLHVEFDHGLTRIIELAGELTGPVFEPLQDEELFRHVTIDDLGTVCWPNGADLAPDALHADIARAKPAHTH